VLLPAVGVLINPVTLALPAEHGLPLRLSRQIGRASAPIIPLFVLTLRWSKRRHRHIIPDAIDVERGFVVAKFAADLGRHAVRPHVSERHRWASVTALHFLRLPRVVAKRCA
jgi:hypothetical protein